MEKIYLPGIIVEALLFLRVKFNSEADQRKLLRQKIFSSSKTFFKAAKNENGKPGRPVFLAERFSCSKFETISRK